MVLSLREAKFCEEFLIDGNQSAAYRRAGWKSKDPRADASRLIRKPDVAARIAELKAAQQERQQRAGEFVLSSLSAIVASRIDDVLDLSLPIPQLKPLDEIPAAALSAIQSICIKTDGEKQEIRLNMWSKLQAAEMLGRHAGLWDDFNGAIATLRKYGIELKQGEAGWEVQDQSAT